MLKKLLIGLLFLASAIAPATAFAAPVSWDFASNILQPLRSGWGALIKADHYQATSTTASIFPYASTTAVSATALCFGTDCRTSWSAGTVTSVTGTYPIISSGGATPAISIAFGTTTANTWSTTQTFTVSPVFSTLGAGTVNSLANGTVYATGTSTPTLATEFTYGGTLGQFIGGVSGQLSLTTNGVALTKLAQVAANTVLGNLTGSTANVTAFATSSLGIAISDTTGTLAVARGGTGVATWSVGQIPYGNGTNAISFVATSSETCSTGVSCTAHTVLTGGGAITLASMSAGVLGTPVTGVPTSQATSTLYGGSSGGMVLGWSNVTGGIAWVATSSGSAGFSGPANSILVSDAAGTAIVATSSHPLYLGGVVATSTTITSNFLGQLTIGTTTLLAGALFEGASTSPVALQFVIGNGKTCTDALTGAATSSVDLIFENASSTQTKYFGNVGFNSPCNTDINFTGFASHDLYAFSSDASLDLATASTTSTTAAIKFFTAGTLAANERLRITNTGFIGQGSTTPTAYFSINPNNIGGTGPAFAIGSSSKNLFRVSQTGLINTALGAGAVSSDANGLLSAGTLGVANGGTGVATFTSGNLIYGNGTNALSSVGTSTPTCGLALTCTNLTTITNQVGATSISIATSSLFSGTVGQTMYFSGTNAAIGTSTVTIDTSEFVGIGSTTPWGEFSIDANGLFGTRPLFAIGSTTGSASGWIATLFHITSGGHVGVCETVYGAGGRATSTAMVFDWNNTCNSILVQLGGSATTINWINATTTINAGSNKKVTVCNPTGTAGALTWPGVEWAGGAAPTQTTTGNQCDIYSYTVSGATSTSAAGSYKLFGAGTTGFN